MYIERPHDRHEFDTTTMKTARQQHVWARPGSLLTASSRQPFVLLAISVLSLRQVSATPIGSNPLSKRDNNDDSVSGTDPKVYVPIVVVCIIIFVLVILSKKTSLRRAVSGFALTGAAPTAGLGRQTGGPRVVTAEQLAGTINGEGLTGTAAAAAPTRRARRPRRTPSQMSVTSLPAYNKEPGEEELVIFRGQDMEDATMPTAVVRQSADESSLSLDHSQVSRYSPMPTSPHTEPLLNPDDTFEGDLSMQSLPLPTDEQTRRSSEGNRQETSSLMRTDTNDSNPDPRGEAPPYFEVVERATSQDTQRTHISPSTSPEPAQSPANRRSGFRTLLNRMSMASQPHGHNRNQSTNSALSSVAGRESTSRASHRRNNPSSSGSVLSASMFRTLSRQRSTHTLASGGLTSPSMISLNSISSPLTHTVTRTEFTYPKTGPTAEQLKVISSREAFARFGVPYGADAIAFASSSRLDLVPPPDFETAASTSQLQLPLPGPSSSGSSGASSETTPQSPSTATTPASPQSSPSPPSSPPAAPSDTPATTLPADGSSISKRHSAVAPVDAATTNSQMSAASDRRSVSEFGHLSPELFAAHHERFGTGASARSTQTFETAAETLRASMRSHRASELGDESGRSTPIAVHVQEPTDATVARPDVTSVQGAAQ